MRHSFKNVKTPLEILLFKVPKQNYHECVSKLLLFANIYYFPPTFKKWEENHPLKADVFTTR